MHIESWPLFTHTRNRSEKPENFKTVYTLHDS